MVKFVDLDPKYVNARGRVSEPIIKAFMDRSVKLVKLDLSDDAKGAMYYRAILSAYVKAHNMPIKVFTDHGDVHMMRLDLNDDNKSIKWSPPEVIND